MQSSSIEKSIIENRIKNSIKSGKITLTNMLNMGKNLSEMTKGTREENKEIFNTILQQRTSRNTFEKDEGR